VLPVGHLKSSISVVKMKVACKKILYCLIMFKKLRFKGCSNWHFDLFEWNALDKHNTMLCHSQSAKYFNLTPHTIASLTLLPAKREKHQVHLRTKA
jgi:hypothetical protein